MGTKDRKSLIKHIDFIAADIITLELSYFLGNVLWYLINRRSVKLDTLFWHQEALLLLCVAVSLLVGNPYKNVLKRNKYQEFSSCVRHTLNLFVLYIFLVFFSHEGGSVSRLTVVCTWVIYFVSEMIFRLVWKKILRKRILESNHRSGDAMILITDCRSRRRIVEMTRGLQSNVYSPHFIKAIFLKDDFTENDTFAEEMMDNPEKEDSTVKMDSVKKYLEGRDSKKPEKREGIVRIGEKIDGIPILGNVDDAIQYSANHWVDEVLIGLRSNVEETGDILQHFERMGIKTHRILLKLPEAWHTGEASVERYGEYIVTTNVLRYVPLWQWGIKRAFDIIGSLVGLMLTGVIFLFVAPRIYHADKGPVIYSSIRIGKNGRQFKFYKFRSMYQDADKRKEELMKQNKMQGLMFKMDNDPRILPGIGHFIRKTSLDEFPQFWNVLKGDMSLVGTRPPTLDEWEQYGEEHRIRMTQRPGITGIWQVSGRSEITDFSEVVRLDEQYIETWTLGMDLSIILKTIGKVFKREGAE